MHAFVATAESAQATGVASLGWLMIAIPLVVSAFLLIAGRRTDRWGHWLATLASWASFAIGAAILIQLIGMAPSARKMINHVFDWAITDEVTIPFALQLDTLSLTFVMLVTFVGSLIHVYSIGYMAHDADRRRFFAYLNLFIASMLTLVLANNYVVLFFGWEGVGLASYLLIGFWNHILENAVAAKKAFVMNRVGDMGLLLAIMSMIAVTGHVDFDTVVAHAPENLTVGWATAIGLFLLLAACGKSAQFPLQAWLGDAMAGPTPVSALIHAATMVTAGVYLMVRSGAVFVMAPAAQLMVAIIGAITLLFGAIVGCAKDDMKKVLAASTMSQIGYMMLGAGLGPIGWTLAIFHLFVHGFFKAQLFLGAGSVMHAMGDQVDIRRFGALRRVMKVSWICFGIAWLAILGIPPFSGFFSKEPIIAAAFSATPFGEVGGWIFGLIAMIGAAITAFYMSRLFFIMFFGKARWTSEAEGKPVHPHEAGWLMNGPIVILSIFSIALGGVLGATNVFERWLSPVSGELAGYHTEVHDTVLGHTTISVLTLALVIVGIVIAWALYIRRDVPQRAPKANALVRAARADLMQDRVNENLAMIPGQGLTAAVGYADRGIIDGIVRGLARLCGGLGAFMRGSENGYTRAYAGYITVGVLAALVIALYVQV
ncbi:NADH-quinone oxidoreductase subunit L [Nanchangia anserum]|uniref:NADH-quinone oxidoreductase subunit L n=1 Tax=Nanchangia anserum TaxID=2692125 RepID=A0A8I0G8X7_9ACTO|nr:NADH-quinone oxidoreductase subunit L [Nanchangia anserum]MBD3689324.1 NADH-quinone oxidoreductase subunit L [Nanchangia anserum]QOX81537.1 NADH-quinone oxidoreductase subunit L [Nanchangia anserum]